VRTFARRSALTSGTRGGGDVLVQRALDISVRYGETCVPAECSVLARVAVTADVLVSVAGGILAALLGVVVGAVLARRAQFEQWSRDRQVDACVSILRESTKAQIGLLRLYRGEAGRPDWAPWNEAMAVIQLVGRSEMAVEVRKMDKVFWESNRSIEHGEVTNDEAWAAIRDAMEGARLKFTNAARSKLVGSSEPLSRLVWRPPAAVRAEDPASGLHQAEGQETNRPDARNTGDTPK
jgi:hypothetical protein